MPPRSVFDVPGPKPPGKRPNGLGRKGKYRFAAACVDIMDDDEAAWWLREMMAGRDPDAPRDAEGNVKPNAYARGISVKDSLRAAEMFFNRRNGQAPQAVVLEQEISVKGRVVHEALSPAAVRAMDPARKAELRTLLRAAVKGELVAGASALPPEVATARDANPGPEGS